MRPTTWLLAALLCTHLNGRAADIVDLLPRVKPAVVGIGTLHPTRNPRIKLLGTGFVVGDGRQIVTNAHIPPLILDSEHKETLAVIVRRGEQVEIRPAERVAADEEHDLLLLKVAGAPLPTLPLGNSDQAREGQALYFTGYPLGAVLGLYPATHRAGLAAIAPVFTPPAGAKGLTGKLIRRANEPFLMFQLDAIAYPGNSGSPLYDPQTGEVLGIVNSVFVKGAKENALTNPSGISYAIPARYIKALLAADTGR